METLLSNVKKKQGLLIVNFGGPRNLKEVAPFLQALLCDQEVLRTPFPKWLHYLIFSRVANKRAKTIAADYQAIGGKSPIYDDTEKVAKALRQILPYPVCTLHRYLPTTHPFFIEQLLDPTIEEWLVFPMFPQFSYTTSGSIAKLLRKKLPLNLENKLRWIKSYPDQKAYVDLFTARIKKYMQEQNIPENKWFLVFSAHGLPQKYIDEGDPYQSECQTSYTAISNHFQCPSILCYQSKFGPGEWVKPYTIDVSMNIETFAKNQKHVLFIPLAFTSDHIETLHEVESEYLPLIREKGYIAHRLAAFNDKADWIKTIVALIDGATTTVTNQMLIRHKN